MSEEGLPGGDPEILSTPNDTTNSATAAGAISVSDPNGDALTVTLGDPGAVLTSGGQPVTWTGVGTGTLVGRVGATPIITVTIDNGGNFAVTLNGPVDHPDPTVEDIVTFNVPVNVSDGTATTPTTLSVTIEDDSPRARPVNSSVVTTDARTNLLLILDTSGSMGNDSGLTGLDRLAVMKASVNELLEQYGSRGEVMVRVVTFDTDGNEVGLGWMDVATAKAAVAALEAGGTTNYDDALLTAMDAFNDSGRLTGSDVENISYFISDGDPTENSDWPQIPGNQEINGIQANEQAVWEDFLTDNNIVSFALGIPDIDSPANLEPIAFDPAAGTQDADTPIIVTDLDQLTVTLTQTIPPFNGNLLLDSFLIDSSFAADGSGFVQSITVDAVTYTFDPAANGGLGDITTSGSGTPSFTYDGATKTLTVDTDPGAADGELTMVMTTGDFTFQAPAGFTSESFDYVLVDRDGDTAGNTLTLTATGADTPPIVRDERVITNITGNGAAIEIPSYALLYNDEDADADPITVTATGLAVGGSVAPASGSPILTVTFTDDAGSDDGGGFQYTGSAASASDTGLVLVDRDQTGTTLNGTGLGEILIGRDGTDNTINAFEDDDVLIAGTGDDNLNGGDGDDLMVGGGGNDALAGGSGDDTFRFVSTTDGTDNIADFDPGTSATTADRLAFDVGALNFSIGNNDTTVDGFRIGDDTAINLVGTEIGVKTDASVATANIQGTIDGYTNITTGALFAFLDSDEGHAVVYHDSNPSAAGGAVLIAELDNITTLGQLGDFDSGDWQFEGLVDSTSALAVGLAAANLNNDLIGDDLGNEILGGPGDNVIDGGAGSDVIIGGDGADRLTGGAGGDALYGGLGVDVISGGADTDYIYGNEDNDRIQGGEAFDGIEGGDGDDTVWGEDGNDALYGGLGNDALNGGAETDYLYGQDGDDVLIGGDAYDAFEGGAGNDTVLGEAGDDVVYAGAGDDFIVGGEGYDYLYGEAGNDTFYHVSGQSEGDAIFGFEAGAGAGDVMRLVGTPFSSFEDVTAAAFETGGYTVIPTGGASAVYLFGISISQLAADDFLFA